MGMFFAEKFSEVVLLQKMIMEYPLLFFFRERLYPVKKKTGYQIYFVKCEIYW